MQNNRHQTNQSANQIPHIRVVKPAWTKGLLSHPHGTRFYLTLPGEPERELPTMREATLHTAFNAVEEVELRMLATLEVVYAEDESA